MSGFEQTDNNTESLMDDVHETDNPVLRESDNPHWNLGEKEEGLSKHGLKDDMDSVFKKVGMLKETDEETESYKTDSDDDSEYSDSLEKAEDGTYYDKETGKQYDSVEAWKKAQETLAKRYESTADFYENKANSEWAKFKNSEANGESEDEKWDHYKKSQEYYNKAKELREKAKAIREKLGENDSNDVDDNKDPDDKKDVDDKKNEDDNKDTGDSKDVNEKGSPIQSIIEENKEKRKIAEEGSDETDEAKEVLTDEEKKKLKELTGWSDEILDSIGSWAEAEIYMKANLKEVEINGKKCLIREDIDLDQTDEDGITNRDRMKLGLAPITKDGEKVELHHIGQKKDSPLAELTMNEHRGTGNDNVLHDKTKESEIDRNKFNTERSDHWKKRVNSEGGQ